MPYGWFAGMMVTVVSASGLDTSRAVIRTTQTREDVVAFCRAGWSRRQVTPECLRAHERPAAKMTANCLTGEFTDLYGSRYRFAGLSQNKDEKSGGPKTVLSTWFRGTNSMDR